MTSFWSGWVIVLTLANLVLVAWLLYANSKTTHGGPGKSTGHTYDGIEEFDNPIPGWWTILFIATFVFSAVYLVVYPGMGNFKGVFGWTSTGQWEEEVKKADRRYGPLFDAYIDLPVAEVATNTEALKMGQRLFANNCSVCHGSDAKGAHGFPNLTDADWLYGGSPEQITATLVNGRNGAMPARGLMPQMTDDQLNDMVQYLLSFSDRAKDQASADRGKAIYPAACSACHGADAKGIQAMGAPNLTDDVWLYGGTPSMIRHTLLNGRQGHMPAQKELLNEAKIHLLAAYVYSLSLPQNDKATSVE